MLQNYFARMYAFMFLHSCDGYCSRVVGMKKLLTACEKTENLNRVLNLTPVPDVS